MARKISHHQKTRRHFPLFAFIGDRYRLRRMRFFLKLFAIRGDERILDVGGEPDFWRTVPEFVRVTLLNLQHYPESGRIHSVCYDGGRFPFPDCEFDIVFSNSTLEHVGSPKSQYRFASEVRRVGRSYFVQTPSPCFPFEPHAMLPFFGFLPAALKRLYLRLWHRSPYSVNELLDIRLVGRRVLKRMFPDGRIRLERFCFWPKSYIIYRQKEDRS